MTTFIVLVVAGFALLSILGAGIMYAYFAGLAAKRAVHWAMGGEQEVQSVYSQREQDEDAELIRSARKAAGLPPIN